MVTEKVQLCQTRGMVKIVDHDERRAQLASAVWKVIERSGMRGATVRAVAQEAGVSPGSLRHYFSDQAGLVRFAAERMTEQVVTRVASHLTSEGEPRATAIAILLECLPADPERRVECAVWLESLLQSRYDPELARLRDDGSVGALHICRVAWAMDAGLDVPDLGEPLAELHEGCAALLHVFLDGLTLQSTTAEQVTAAELATQLGCMLDTLHASTPGVSRSR